VKGNDRLDKRTSQVGLRFKNLDEAWQFWVPMGVVLALMLGKDIQITTNLIVR